MAMNPRYLKARRKAMTDDGRKAERFSDWNRLCLISFSFSAISLIGWLPGCILSAALDLLALYDCGRKNECGRKLALCGLFFTIIGAAMAVAAGTWRDLGRNLVGAAFAYMVMAVIMSALVIFGLYGYYRTRRHR